MLFFLIFWFSISVSHLLFASLAGKWQMSIDLIQFHVFDISCF